MIQLMVSDVQIFGRATDEKHSKWIVRVRYHFDGGHSVYAETENVFYSIRRAKAYCKKRKMNICKMWNFKEWKTLTDKIREEI